MIGVRKVCGRCVVYSNLTDPKLELEMRATVPRAVELLPVVLQSTSVVYLIKARLIRWTLLLHISWSNGVLVAHLDSLALLRGCNPVTLDEGF